MNWLDVVLLLIVLAFAALSFSKGFMRELLSVFVWFLSIFITKYCYLQLAKYLIFIDSIELRNILSIVIIFVVVLLLGATVSKFVIKVLELSGLDTTDKVLGILVGLFKGLIVVSVIVHIVNLIDVMKMYPVWKESVLVNELENMHQWFFSLFYKKQ